MSLVVYMFYLIYKIIEDQCHREYFVDMAIAKYKHLRELELGDQENEKLIVV